jgi:hypothetical protein
MLTDQQYYSSASNYGSYQYITIPDIVKNFQLMYTGDEEQVFHNIDRFKIIFHAKRGIQEFQYDAANEMAILELTIPSNLKVVLPPDYINYVKLSLNINGTLFKMFESNKAISAQTYLADSNNQTVYDSNGEVVTVDSTLDSIRVQGILTTWSAAYSAFGWYVNDCWYFPYNITLFGLDTAEANGNPSFLVDKQAGVINFSSGTSGQKVIMEYISDGMKLDDANIGINKMAEDYIYSYIKWAILNSKSNVPMYTIQAAQKEKDAKWRNAKIRLSGLHPTRLLMTLRGQDKWVK